MKKILCFIITISLILSSVSIAYAKPSESHGKKDNKPQTSQSAPGKKDTGKSDTAKGNSGKSDTGKSNGKGGNGKSNGKSQSFKIEGSPVIKYGSYKIPIRPITKGMGATLDFNKTTGVLTVKKDATTLVLDLKNKTATVNGVADTSANIFNVSNSKKTNVLLKYIADKLGVRITFSKDKITTEDPEDGQISAVTVTPVGTATVANTLNATTLYLTASANVTAGKATGGRAELYVGTKLVAADTAIAATDTTVTFSTSDGTPTNAELQALIPVGGAVSVKLYDATGNLITTLTSTTPLTVDYSVPTVAGATSAVYAVSGSALTVTVVGAGTVNDKVDVTKITLFDTILNKSYQLTNAASTGSTGVVSSDSVLTIQLGSADLAGLAGFGTSTVYLYIAPGALLYDTAGNTSAPFSTTLTVPVTIVR